ncbi:MAG: type II glyceraldehyde-3-phosphate dehydrogenase [Caldisphaeraceae archaeon]|nr:type II glyceraldehyde-3-phosphate dehydrogenase [Caldisphaeraceae archaeon]
MSKKVKVGINGFGTIGKRIAMAINKQNDMSVSGIIKKRPDYNAYYAVEKGFKIYAVSEKEAEAFQKAGIEVRGTLVDLIKESDIIIDATPGGIGETYRPLYSELDINVIYQGGERASVAEGSFNALCNYDESMGKKTLRVVSCNTTGLLRSICALKDLAEIKKVDAVLIRRGADPPEIKKGPINAITINPPTIPSHHAHDVKTVLPWVNISTAAVVVPTTLMHVHHVTIRFKHNIKKNEIIEILNAYPRIIMVDSKSTKIESTAQLMDAARLGREKGDINELVIFEDSITIEKNELQFFQAVHQESIVIPENIDAIRASLKLAQKLESIKETDRTLGLTKRLY